MPLNQNFDDLRCIACGARPYLDFDSSRLACGCLEVLAGRNCVGCGCEIDPQALAAMVRNAEAAMIGTLFPQRAPGWPVSQACMTSEQEWLSQHDVDEHPSS